MNQITCFGILSSSKNFFHGFGLCSIVSSQAFRQVRMIHSCSSSSKREINKENTKYHHVRSALCITRVQLKQAIFPLRKKSIFSHWHLLEHIFFVSLKDCVVLCWNLSRQEVLDLWQWLIIGLFDKVSLGRAMRFTCIDFIFFTFWQEICWNYQKWRYTFFKYCVLLVGLWKVNVKKKL